MLEMIVGALIALVGALLGAAISTTKKDKS